MNKKTIFWNMAVLVAVLAVFVWFAGPERGDSSQTASVAGGPDAELVAEEPFFDFGSIRINGGNVSHAFKIRNTGPKPVLIAKIYTSCMCTSASLIKSDASFGPFGMPGHGFAKSLNQAIQPNEEVEIEAVFDPAAHGPAGVGRADRAIYLDTGASEPFELRFSAIVTP